MVSPRDDVWGLGGLEVYETKCVNRNFSRVTCGSWRSKD